MVQPERMQTIRRLRVAYWISKPTRSQAHTRARVPTHTRARTHAHEFRTHTHTLTKARARAHTHTQKYVTLIAFHGDSGFVNTRQYYLYIAFLVSVNITIFWLKTPRSLWRFYPESGKDKFLWKISICLIILCHSSKDCSIDSIMRTSRNAGKDF